MHAAHNNQQQQPFNGRLSGTTRVGRYQRNIHPLTPILVNVLPLSPFSICNGPRHPLYSAYVLDSPLEQPLSRSSLVFPLVLNPQLHTPCISSPNHHHLFAAHAHTDTACSAAISMLCQLHLVSLSAPYFSLTPHIHLTILISARWSATTLRIVTRNQSTEIIVA